MQTLKMLIPDLDSALADIEVSDIKINKEQRSMTLHINRQLDDSPLRELELLLCGKFKLQNAQILCNDTLGAATLDIQAAERYQQMQDEAIERLKSQRNSVTKNEVILGKKIKGALTPLSEISPELGKIRTNGRIFCTEYKQRRDGAWIVSVDISDHVGAITLKLFCDMPMRGGIHRGSNISKDTLEKRLKTGVYIAVSGDITFDKYLGDYVIMADNICELEAPPAKTDDAEVKRVELHLHTQMSAMDGITPVKDLVARAAAWGHKAIAITDHGVVQAFPDAADAAKKHGIKIIYGVEGYVVDDSVGIVSFPRDSDMTGTFVVFDLETTGLSAERNHIIEIGAIKVTDGEVKDSFSSFVDPGYGIPTRITEITGITDAMIAGAPAESKAVGKFLEFCGNAVLVAHNASFDTGFIRAAMNRMNKEFETCNIDTVALSRKLLPELGNHKLNTVAKHLKISLDNHHRAVDDAMATAKIFIHMSKMLAAMGVHNTADINDTFSGSTDVRGVPSHHIILLAKNYTGLKNLYHLISESHLNHFYRTPRMPKSLINKYREGLIIGSACESGELYSAISSGKSPTEIARIADFYDYFEIQPLGNNEFMIRNNEVNDFAALQDINRRIIAFGRKYNKPVVATGDVHFMDPPDEAYRRILMASKGFSDADLQAPLYMRTTDEMLNEFSYLDAQTAYDVVIANPNLIADMVEVIKPVPDETFPPIIDGAEDDIIRMSTEKAAAIYGTPLPDIVQKRMDKELKSITTYGFSVMYIIAQKLVSKSLEDGYLVGSRGSVGSSFVAFLSGITEVNSLAAHYICPSCKYSDFPDGFAGVSGCDMPDAICPKCQTALIKDGHDIPFETFLGFEGDKEPDIDLNFSGAYQSVAHKYTEELFGEGHVFRAGTIGTVADKTAYGYVRKYFEERSITAHNTYMKYLATGCTGVKRTSGQHPGGVMIVPHNKDIHEFCPINYPADSTESKIITTHFDYHSISGKLLKLDILGHDDPTVIRMLEDLTGLDAKTIQLDDAKVLSLFLDTSALGVTNTQIGSDVGTFGVPEFGTSFVRQMLLDTKPTKFSELVRISGLSHGTDVWLNNAQEYIKSGEAVLSETICTRDDIMIYLIDMGLDSKQAFNIMEKVRKGKGLNADDETAMKANNVPQWYIDSCNKIKYMFPKAHAVAYVMMAFRVAYFKVYYPMAYYIAYFTIRAEGDFDAELMCYGVDKVKAAMAEIRAKEKPSAKEEGVYTALELCLEMYARGLNFVPVDLYKSHATNFTPMPDGILPPLCTLPAVSAVNGQSIVAEREKGEFFSIEDLHERTKISKTALDSLERNGCFKGLPRSSQVSLFDL